MCGKCNLLSFELDQAADGLAAEREYTRKVEAERDSLLLQVDYLKADRDTKREERDALRAELARVKARVLAAQVGVDVYGYFDGGA